MYGNERGKSQLLMPELSLQFSLTMFTYIQRAHAHTHVLTYTTNVHTQAQSVCVAKGALGSLE
jgi:hypothetical protein